MNPKPHDLPYSRPSSPSKNALQAMEREASEVPSAPWTTAAEKNEHGDEPRKFDSTGMFHWCASRSITEAIMVSRGTR